MRPMSYNRRALYITAAAALGSSFSKTATSSYGFSPPAFIPRRNPGAVTNSQQSRLYSSNSKNGGILGTLTKVAKSILPKSWTQRDEERKLALKKKEVQNEIAGGLDQMLQSAPLPVRMIGKMIAPLLSSAFSGLASEMGQQQRQLQELLEDAQIYIVADAGARQALGEPIEMQQPFSQATSTTLINGKSSSNIQAAFYVSGSRAQGIVQLTASEQGITRLILEVSGRQMEVSLNKSKWSHADKDYLHGSDSIGKNRINRDDVIDVEFVETKYKP